MPGPRLRVIVDNDFSGDPDDLFQLAHHVLSPSVEIPFVIGSHLAPGDGFDPSAEQAGNAVRVATELLELIGGAGRIPVLRGSDTALTSPLEPVRSPGAEAIVAEALRDDTDLPLVVALGGGLTELASALLIEPAIADRLTAVWIGGPEHEGLAVPPPGAAEIEYNLNIDLAAGISVFNHSRVPLWQVPRDVYRQCLVSQAELDLRVRPAGRLGAHLMRALDRVAGLARDWGGDLGETYVLGDSPLVLLTALRSSFEPDTSSSAHVTVPMPRLTPRGTYEPDPHGRPLRVYTRVDTRLVFEDLYAKLAREQVLQEKTPK
ncbi:nucleoside hydrolase [Kineosporia sp. J2-2]|uniref:Nucleoside hydrolase n=1 Tax=Kineosporia corallincola TaxID=2835133 RepID=A0ABS5TK18_9ACTN|nr:nucleoside hydrolase [Kineosporia corallincola]MBT0771453.1 nucleoside hydrolase [Kineosporia corallincola]